MRHGFKAKAERMAQAARDEMGLSILDCLDGPAYARHVGAAVLPFDKLSLSAKAKKQLLVSDPESWSGMTIKDGATRAIVLNPAHTLERQNNTIMHELSHILLRHVPARVDLGPDGIMIIAEYPEEEESEADWLAGTLLLPRPALMVHRSRGMTNQQIATRYRVSPALCDWRTRMTGIDVQLRRAATR